MGKSRDAIPGPTRGGIASALNREFASDWSDVRLGGSEHWEANFLTEFVTAAAEFPPNAKPLLWVLTHAATTGRGDPTWADGIAGPASFPIGIAGVRKLPLELEEATYLDGLFWWHYGWTDGGANSVLTGGANYELFFWVRPAYRTAEVGRDVLRPLLATIDQELPPIDRRHLVARFPKAARGSEGIVRALWTTFFNDHDFHNYRLREGVAAVELRLRRRV